MVDQTRKLQQYVPLENAILKATSETLQKPDEQAFKEACEIINSKPDMLNKNSNILNKKFKAQRSYKDPQKATRD